MKVILCGYNWTGCKALETLLSNGHEVFVFTHKNPHHVASLVELCDRLQVSHSLDNISQVALPFVPDVICSIYYRHIIKRPVIERCEGRIFNLHPSLLPKYRGCSSLTWAMINGEAEAGFTYHYIDEDCDTGPILLQRPINVEAWDTQQSLYMRVMFESMKYFLRAFEMVAAGSNGTPQAGASSYYSRECPYGGEIDPTWDDAMIERFIRAMNYPPYPSARFSGTDIHTMQDYLRQIADNETST